MQTRELWVWLCEIFSLTVKFWFSRNLIFNRFKCRKFGLPVALYLLNKLEVLLLSFTTTKTFAYYTNSYNFPCYLYIYSSLSYFIYTFNIYLYLSLDPDTWSVKSQNISIKFPNKIKKKKNNQRHFPHKITNDK